MSFLLVVAAPKVDVDDVGVGSVHFLHVGLVVASRNIIVCWWGFV
jgi:hypothetical protein